MIPTALPDLAAGSYHIMDLYLNSNFISLTNGKTLDLEYNKPVCFLQNTRVHICSIDTVNRKMRMMFTFGIPSNVPVHAYFSVLDPRDPSKNGFRYNSGFGMDTIYIELFNNGASPPFSVQSQPFVVKESHTLPTNTLP